jgi:type II secretory ATPase GspE/PulE/Tfp pilus assembly ATPase PilB-like protein
VSQRLVRKLCLDCRKLGKISEIDLVRLASPRLNAETQVYHPVGCHKCRNQGFKGRTPISELLAPDAVIRKAIISRGSEDIIIDHLKSVESFRVMREDGIDKIIAGITTPTEILKATLAED